MVMDNEIRANLAIARMDASGFEYSYSIIAIK
jgi:hypothetical protein